MRGVDMRGVGLVVPRARLRYRFLRFLKPAFTAGRPSAVRLWPTCRYKGARRLRVLRQGSSSIQGVPDRVLR